MAQPSACARLRSTPTDHRPIQLILIALSFVTGMLDAVTYLAFGHVFAANMTGNVVELGFAVVGAGNIASAAPLIALGAFIGGSVLGAYGSGVLQSSRHHWFLTMLSLETGLLTVAAAVTLTRAAQTSDTVIVGLLALAMGMRTVTVRRLGLSDVSTTVLTSTLAALAADILTPRAALVGTRLVTVTVMLLGAATGALLLTGGAAQVLATAAGLLMILTIGYAALASPPFQARSVGARLKD